MIYPIYTILSIIIAAFAVKDYAQETARRNIFYLSGVWVVFCIIWPLVIGNYIIQACRDVPEKRDSKLNYSYRSNYNCSPEYLEKVKQLVQTTKISIEDIDWNEFNFDRRLTLEELDFLDKYSVYGISTCLPKIENMDELINKIKITN